MKRKVDIVVISDTHLGTYGCHANELFQYLNSIDPDKIILNGDIIDVWQFNKKYFPSQHMNVLNKFLEFITEGKEVYYITGNHDEVFRKFTGFQLGNFQIVNKVILNINGYKTWFFHGDVFDITMKHSKWLAKLGGKGYDLLILLNRFINKILVSFGKEKLSLSKKIKNSVKSAVKFIDNFEQTALQIAEQHDFDTVVCGHIHKPCIKKVEVNKRNIMYLNSGDWIENLTALECIHGQWKLYSYEESSLNIPEIHEKEKSSKIHLSHKVIFEQLIQELKIIS